MRLRIGGIAELFSTQHAETQTRAAGTPAAFNSGADERADETPQTVVVVFERRSTADPSARKPPPRDAAAAGRGEAAAGGADVDPLDRAIRALVGGLEEERAQSVAVGRASWLAGVRWGFDTAEVGPRMLLTQPLAVVEAATAGLGQLSILLEADSPTDLLRRGMQRAMTEALGQAVGGRISSGGRDGEAERAGHTDDAAANRGLAVGARVFGALMDAVAERLGAYAEAQQTDSQGGAEQGVWWPRLRSAALGETWQWLEVAGGRRRVVLVQIPPATSDTARGSTDEGGSGGVARLREHVAAVGARFPQIDVGITGPAAVAQELESAWRPTVAKAIGAAAGVLVVFSLWLWRSASAVAWRLAAVGLMGVWGLGGVGGIGGLWLMWGGATVWPPSVLPGLAVAGWVTLLSAWTWSGRCVAEPADPIRRKDRPRRYHKLLSVHWWGVGLAGVAVWGLVLLVVGGWMPIMEGGVGAVGPGVAAIGWGLAWGAVCGRASLGVCGLQSGDADSAAANGAGPPRESVEVGQSNDDKDNGTVGGGLAVWLAGWSTRNHRGAWLTVGVLAAAAAGVWVWSAAGASSAGRGGAALIAHGSDPNWPRQMVRRYLPADLDSLQWMDRATEAGHTETGHGKGGLAAALLPIEVWVPDMATAEAAVAWLGRLEWVARTGGAAALVIQQPQAKREAVQRLDAGVGSAAAAVLADPPPPPQGGSSAGNAASFFRQLAAVRGALTLAASRADAGPAANLQDMVRAADRVLAFRESAVSPNADVAPRWSAVRADFFQARYAAADTVRQLLVPGPIRRTDLGVLDGLLADYLQSPPPGAQGRGDWPGGLRLEVFADPTRVTMRQALANTRAAVAGLEPSNANANNQPQPSGSGVVVGGVLDRWSRCVEGLAAARRWVLGSCVLVGWLILGWSDRAGTAAGRWAVGTAVLGLTILVYGATLTGLGGAWDAVGWVGLLLTLPGVVTWVGSQQTPKIHTDREPSAGAQPLAGESLARRSMSLGLVLSAGFALTAGVRGGGSTGLTAMAVAACLSLLAGCVTGLMLRPGAPDAVQDPAPGEGP